eukprot:TRINITY_DN23866_c0_g1_i1.p1 TRINITY_DN23866_c0_g1~~TRINITY_DN23866_c0_g1_i1.p1  ORF type:complete len:569 (-),score=133.43 TRINITY_DN23866_c0_g1_i1:416-2077(-)
MASGAVFQAYRVRYAAEVRQAASVTSAVFHEAQEGRIVKQVGDIVDLEGVGKRVPILPRGWIDLAALEPVDATTAAAEAPTGGVAQPRAEGPLGPGQGKRIVDLLADDREKRRAAAAGAAAGTVAAGDAKGCAGWDEGGGGGYGKGLRTSSAVAVKGGGGDGGGGGDDSWWTDSKDSWWQKGGNDWTAESWKQDDDASCKKGNDDKSSGIRKGGEGVQQTAGGEKKRSVLNALADTRRLGLQKIDAIKSPPEAAIEATTEVVERLKAEKLAAEERAEEYRLRAEDLEAQLAKAQSEIQELRQQLAGTVPSPGLQQVTALYSGYVRYVRDNGELIIDCPEAATVYGCGEIRLLPEMISSSCAEGAAVCFLLKMNMSEARPEIITGSLAMASEVRDTGCSFIGTMKSFSLKKHPEHVGWATCAVMQHLYRTDVYVHGSMLDGLKEKDVIRFSVRLNAKEQPQAAIGSVSLVVSSCVSERPNASGLSASLSVSAAEFVPGQQDLTAGTPVDANTATVEAAIHVPPASGGFAAATAAPADAAGANLGVTAAALSAFQ